MSIRQIPVGTNGEAVTVLTGAGIDVFRFLSLRAMLKLEKAGMKGSGGALRPRLAKQFGLNPRDPHKVYIDFCTARIEAGKQEVVAENMTEDAIAKAKGETA